MMILAQNGDGCDGAEESFRRGNCGSWGRTWLVCKLRREAAIRVSPTRSLPASFCSWPWRGSR